MSWPLFSITSGATYSGVPQNVQVFRPTWKKKRSVETIFGWFFYRQFLGKTKVYKLYIATCIQKQVLWLEVPEINSASMKDVRFD